VSSFLKRSSADGFEDFHESKGQNLALTVLHMPYSLDSEVEVLTSPPRSSIFAPFSQLRAQPLSSQLGTNKTVKAIFWPWLEPFFRNKTVEARFWPWLQPLGRG
jgi:hypothetical protein